MLLLSLLVVVPLALAQFSFPPQGYIFRTGETQKITWHTTFQNFTVGLWQQALAGGSASLGPILIQATENGPTITQFDWVAQTYGFDLQTSDKFFFWLVAGDAIQQGNQSAPAITSAYFLITGQNSSSGSASSQPTTTILATSQAWTSSLTTTANTNPRPSSGSGSEQSEGLSSGSVAGISVAASLVGIVAVFGVIYWMRQLGKKQKELVIQLEQQNQQHTIEQATLDKQVVVTSTPLNMADNRYRHFVEMG